MRRAETSCRVTRHGYITSQIGSLEAQGRLREALHIVQRTIAAGRASSGDTRVAGAPDITRPEITPTADPSPALHRHVRERLSARYHTHQARGGRLAHCDHGGPPGALVHRFVTARPCRRWQLVSKPTRPTTFRGFDLAGSGRFQQPTAGKGSRSHSTCCVGGATQTPSTWNPWTGAYEAA